MCEKASGVPNLIDDSSSSVIDGGYETFSPVNRIL